MIRSEGSEPDGAGIDVGALFARVEERLLDGPRRHTRRQVAEATGVAPDGARALWRALGFATVGDDDVVFTDGDVRALEQARFLRESAVISDDVLTAMTRMLGQTFSRLASWQGQLLVEILTSRPDLLDSADSIGEFVEEIVPVMEQLQDYVWRRQLVAYFARVASRADGDVAAPGSATTAVGFVDMSGFTALTRRASETELRELLDAFESAATDIVGAHHGRIVKTIGDEVLFVAGTPEDGAEIALDLLAAAVADERLPALRAGLAAGAVVSRLGDVYGSTVNIASRLSSLSRPGWVLVDRIMAESLRADERYTLKSRRPESVRGFHHLRQWRLRRAEGTCRR